MLFLMPASGILRMRICISRRRWWARLRIVLGRWATTEISQLRSGWTGINKKPSHRDGGPDGFRASFRRGMFPLKWTRRICRPANGRGAPCTRVEWFPWRAVFRKYHKFPRWGRQTSGSFSSGCFSWSYHKAVSNTETMGCSPMTPWSRSDNGN